MTLIAIPPKVEEMCDLYKDGMSMTAIGEQMEMTRAGVSYQIRKYARDMLRHPCPICGKEVLTAKKHCSRHCTQIAYRRNNKQTYTAKSCLVCGKPFKSRFVYCSPECRRIGITKSRNPNYIDRRKEAIELYKSGLTVKEVAEQCNYTTMSIYHFLSDAKISLRDRIASRNKKMGAQRQEGCSVVDLAEAFSVSKQVVWRVTRKDA